MAWPVVKVHDVEGQTVYLPGLGMDEISHTDSVDFRVILRDKSMMGYMSEMR